MVVERNYKGGWRVDFVIGHSECVHLYWKELWRWLGSELCAWIFRVSARVVQGAADVVGEWMDLIGTVVVWARSRINR